MLLSVSSLLLLSPDQSNDADWLLLNIRRVMRATLSRMMIAIPIASVLLIRFDLFFCIQLILLVDLLLISKDNLLDGRGDDELISTLSVLLLLLND